MAWLERGRLPLPPGECPAPLAVRAWNMMGGLDWSALPIVAERLGVADIEFWLDELLAIRDFQRGAD